MNDNFIEEENTVYEIDPDCQIGNLKNEDGRWRGQSCGSGCFSDCRENHWPQREADDDSQERCQRKNGCNFNWWILVILFWCFCQRE